MEVTMENNDDILQEQVETEHRRKPIDPLWLRSLIKIQAIIKDNLPPQEQAIYNEISLIITKLKRWEKAQTRHYDRIVADIRFQTNLKIYQYSEQIYQLKKIIEDNNQIYITQMENYHHYCTEKVAKANQYIKEKNELLIKCNHQIQKIKKELEDEYQLKVLNLESQNQALLDELTRIKSEYVLVKKEKVGVAE
jgi:hypothetical protein